MGKRIVSYIGVASLAIGLVVGCSSPQQTTPAGGAKTDTKVTVPQAIATTPAGDSKAAASPAAKTAASPAASPATAAKTAASPAAAPATGQRVEPQGRLVYAWHTAITPSWVDPLENPALITPYAFQYALHDAVIKHMPGQPFAPSLAESYEVASDNRSATIKLRPNLKFHDGSPVTSEDVKFTYENYKGANAQILKSKTTSIETPDAQTVKFNFSEPFLDFLMLYGSPATGAGWVVPAKYYQQVGPDGYKQNPI
ncbi:MAG TPA: ABC transporter substrate-binding protein, partial [Dehalococcoidia bacterium]|nr:ABC transporter substrate-binding protein [Dehalococcoidia bacterium]